MLKQNLRGALWGLAIVALLGTSCQRAGPAVDNAPSAKIVKTKGGVEMVEVPGGAFEMGSRSGRPDEAPVHRVSIAPLLMDRYEVTQAEYARLAVVNPSHFKGPTMPVEQVSWADAARYCNARSREEGLKPCYNEETAECNVAADGYRLPTEAEWEYACRAETTGDYPFDGEARRLGQHAWFAENAGKKTHPVGQKRPNAWGLYDMLGNVAEWCNDVYEADYYRASPEKDPVGPADGERYLLRGGAWNSSADACRSAHRLGESPGFQDACFARDAIGFRCVRRVGSVEPNTAVPAPK